MTRRNRRTVVAAAIVAVLAGLAGTAAAQEPPDTAAPSTTTSTSTYTPTVELDDLELSPGEAAILNELVGGGDVTNPCAAAPDTPAAGSASIVPDDCWGRFPSSHYDIGCDEGAWNHISRKVYCTFTDLAFQGARSSTAVALWLVEWAYGWSVYDRLGGSAVTLAETWDTGLIGPLGLGHLAWVYAVAWAAITGLRGRLTMAAGELLTSIVLAGLAGLLLANLGGYLRGTFETMSTVSGALLATGTGEPPPDDPLASAAVLDPLQAQLHAAFVEQPYDLINWGTPLTDGSCAAMRDRIVAAGPHGNSDGPREAMNAAGCDDQADFNHEPNANRLFGAVLTFGAAGVMTVLVALVSLTVVVAQMLAIVLFALAPFALLAGILPGGGREAAWRWVAALVRVVLAVIGMSAVLSVLLLTIQALLEASTGAGLVERFALVNVVVVAAFVARKRVISAGHGLAASMGQRLSSRRVGGDRAAPWLAAPAAAGATGFALGAALGPDRPTRTGRLAATAGRNHMANRRVARQGQAAEARANRTVARQRTEITTGQDGKPRTRTAVTVDGPAPASRRARAARQKLETRAATDHVRPPQSSNNAWPRRDNRQPTTTGDTSDGGTEQEPRRARPTRRQSDTTWSPPPEDPGDDVVDVEDT